MDEINRIRYIQDPSQLTLEDIHQKLRDIDPNLYREAMANLDFEGNEPVWARYDFLERIRMLGKDGQADPMDETNPEILRKEVERLMVEKERLAKGLILVQNQLRDQVSLDKETTTGARLQIEQLESTVQHDTQGIKELTELIHKRNAELLKITKAAGPQALT